MEVLGVLQVPRLFSPPADDETWRAIAWYVHYWSGWALLGLVLLHVAGALWHQYIRRDGLISQRML
jgi:cytochrome b561